MKEKNIYWHHNLYNWFGKSGCPQFKCDILSTQANQFQIYLFNFYNKKKLVCYTHAIDYENKTWIRFLQTSKALRSGT